MREAARDGKLHLRVLPLFLALVLTLQKTFPADRGRSGSFPQVKIELLQPIGEHPRVKELFREIACDYVRD